MPLLKDDYVKTEKINGIIYNMSPSGSYFHGQINGNIYFSLRNQLKNSICAVSMENLDLYLSEDEYVIPDVMLICDRKQIKKNGYHGVPRLIVETLSPATALKDRTVKKDKYAQIGVDEYWIISPQERSIEIYYLENGGYTLVASYILEDDTTDEHYNAETVITLKAMPSVSVQLREIFENID
ncbi:Uma2 family endonuclease [Blautia sp. HCP3S3_G3]|uniref:Uma2 family endonuclease n=1 Tax=Blautia sp. HCP3S3_G3 TaxID=3438913 RepID=UPI003F887905